MEQVPGGAKIIDYIRENDLAPVDFVPRYSTNSASTSPSKGPLPDLMQYGSQALDLGKDAVGAVRDAVSRRMSEDSSPGDKAARKMREMGAEAKERVHKVTQDTKAAVNSIKKSTTTTSPENKVKKAQKKAEQVVDKAKSSTSETLDDLQDLIKRAEDAIRGQMPHMGIGAALSDAALSAKESLEHAKDQMSSSISQATHAVQDRVEHIEDGIKEKVDRSSEKLGSGVSVCPCHLCYPSK